MNEPTLCERCHEPILPGAPRHAFGYVVHDSSRPAVASYHPGCWAAQVRANGGQMVDTGKP